MLAIIALAVVVPRMVELPIGPWGLSADGHTVVGSVQRSGVPVPCRWSSKNGLTFFDLGKFDCGTAFHTSADGSVTVGKVGRLDGDREDQIVVWHGARLWKVVAKPALNVPPSISADGNVVAGTTLYPLLGRFRVRAFVWSADKGLTPLGVFDPKEPYSNACAMSSDGSMIIGFGNGSIPISTSADTIQPGGSGRGMSAHMGCYWVSGQDSPIAIPRPANFISMMAMCCSADGQRICGFGNTMDVSGSSSFTWSSRTGVTVLVPPKGIDGSEVNGMSADGSIVFGYANSIKGKAIIWTDGLYPLTVEDYLRDRHVAGLEGWAIEMVEGVSEDNKVIVGRGMNPKGKPACWMVDLGSA